MADRVAPRYLNKGLTRRPPGQGFLSLMLAMLDMSDDIRAFIAANKAQLKAKD